MSEVKLKIEDSYLSTFLQLVESLKYVSVEQVKTPRASKKIGLVTLPKDHPLREAIKSIRPFVPLQVLAKEQNYTKTNWAQLDKMVETMDIQEPLEELLEQLKS